MKSKLFLYISLWVDVLIATCKFIAAFFTGSSSMVSEGIHSVIDATSQVLLIWGVKTSKKEADYNRPFGYGRELYFWSFIVSLIIFLVGGCASIYEGVTRLHRPDVFGNTLWNYSILGLSFLFNTVSLVSVLKVFNQQRGDTPFWKAVRHSKDPSTFIVLLGDVGDLIGLVVAFAGIYLARRFHNPYFDAAASCIIGAVLIIISMLLVRESKSLLMGEPMRKTTLARIVKMIEADATILEVKQHFSTYLAPEEIILQINAVFKDGLETSEITEGIERIIQTVQKKFPNIKQIFIEPVAS